MRFVWALCLGVEETGRPRDVRTGICGRRLRFLEDKPWTADEDDDEEDEDEDEAAGAAGAAGASLLRRAENEFLLPKVDIAGVFRR